MFINEPPRTAYDLQFRLLGVPIRVHPMFWLVSVVFGMGGQGDPAYVALWVAGSFLSIVVHEMGHALCIRAYGWQPWVTLYGMGGLASGPPARRSPQTQILISLAGPAAGFALFGLVVAIVAATGHRVEFDRRLLPGAPVVFGGFDNVRAWEFAYILAWQNFAWNVLNLLPIFPLDGGQVARETWRLVDPRDGLRRSLMLSIAAAGGMAAWAVMKGNNIYLTLFFAFLAYESFVLLERMFPGQGFGGGKR